MTLAMHDMSCSTCSWQSFVDVTITEAGVDTAEFCEAAENLVKIFGSCMVRGAVMETY
jgi:hypothetical protein